ncbi:MAG TPA: RNA polymerase factor sigma-54, partial [Burkholderiales bacterium]|nr:RNA polymerase factor sigma-54 [Burkholderiales bacterium]
MKHSLQLKLSQHLTLTPQLQQSIRLLQLSTLELNQEIERFLQDNPLLERDEGAEEEGNAAQAPAAAPVTAEPTTPATTSTTTSTTSQEESEQSHAAEPEQDWI